MLKMSFLFFSYFSTIYIVNVTKFVFLLWKKILINTKTVVIKKVINIINQEHNLKKKKTEIFFNCHQRKKYI